MDRRRTESGFSLIEIAGEDDSLLQSTPAPDAGTNFYFSCSPLQCHGSGRSAVPSRASPLVGLKDNVDSEKPTCSSVGTTNKENITVNKSEVPKLSVDPQRMKRTKKGGAYNFRKSLAWDRAFFTEEGVLDPQELSVLNGNFGNSNVKVLPTLHEEGAILSHYPRGSSDSLDLQVVDICAKKLMQVVQKKVEIMSSLLIKLVSSAQDYEIPTYLGMPKACSHEKRNRIGSKTSGSPRPVAFSSLKRPASASSTKGSIKESKLPKIPVSRSGVHSLPKSIRSNVASTSLAKHDWIGQADTVQKSAGLQCSSKNPKSCINKEKDNSALEVSSSTKPRLPAVMEVDCSLEVLPASGQATVSRAPPDGYGKTGNLIPQNTRCISGNMQYIQFQTTKPSGLRMPSPSLGFFSQPKSRASSSSLQKPSQPSNIPGSRGPNLQRVKVSNDKLDPRLLLARQKMPKIDNNATVDENARISGLSTECSVSWDNSHASHESGKLKLEGNSVKKVELMSKCYPVSSRMMEEKQVVHNITDGHKVLQECDKHDIADQRYSESSDSDFQINVHRLMQSGSSDQLKDSTNDATISHPKTRGSKITVLDNSITSQISQMVCVGTVDIARQKLLKDKKCDYSVACEVISQPHSKYDAVSIGHGLADSSINMHDIDELPSKSAELIQASASKYNQIAHAENHHLLTNNRILLEDRKSAEIQKYESDNIVNINSDIFTISRSERLSSSSFPRESADQANEVAAGVDQFTDRLHVKDIEVNSSDGTCLVKDTDNINNTPEVNNQYLVVDKNKKSRDHPEPQSDCLLVEQTSKLNNGFLLDQLPLGRQSAGLEVSLNVIPEKGDDYGTEINCSKVLVTQFERGIQDCGVDVHEIVVQPQMEATLSTSVHMVPPVKSKKCNIDTQFSSGLLLQERSDHTAGVVTTFSSMEYSLSRKEEDMRAKGLKNRLLPDESGTEVSSESSDEENKRTMMNGGILFEERRSLDKFCTGDLVNAVGVNFINQGSAGIKLKSHLLENGEQVNKEEAGTHKMPNDLCVGDEKSQSLDGNLFVGNSNNRLSSAVDNQFIMVPDVNGQSGGQSHITSHSIVADRNTKDNYGLHLNGCILFGKCPTSEECQEEKLLANFPVFKEESGSKRSCVAIRVPLTVQDSGVHVESGSEHGHMEEAHSGSVNSDTLAEHGNSADKKIGNGTVVSYQATSSHSDMPLMMREDQTSGVTTHYKEICLNEESGPLVRIQTSANENKIVELGVDKSRMVDDIEVEISPKNVSPTGELPHTLDSAVCLTEDGDMAVPIKKLEDGGKQSNLMIAVNAVPFSDEWLAAMEAAGEEILTIKSGAVQNSPTDKSVQPEPGPWSPVKRKQNQIGPFDCTKFTNCPPPISD